MDPLLIELKELETERGNLLAKAETADFAAADSERAEAVIKRMAELKEVIAKRQAVSKGLREAGMGEGSPEVEDGVSGSLGERFVGSDAFKSFQKSSSRGISKGAPINIEAASLGSLRKAATLNTGAPGNAAAVRIGDVDDLVYRPERTFLDLITRGGSNIPWFEYRQIISKTNNAAIVGESVTTDGVGTAGGLAPVSTLTTQTAEAKAFTYADGMEVTNQELADDKIISTVINSTLVENLEIRIEDILLNGAGTADEPAGLFNVTGVLAQAFAVDAPTTLRKAMTKLSTTSGGRIQAVVLNPEDDELWDLLKDLEGRYLSGGPFAGGPKTAWGYERIGSASVPVGQAVLGDFKTIHLLDYTDVAINAFNQHKDFAQRGLSYIRAEQRALQVFRNPAKICIADVVSG